MKEKKKDRRNQPSISSGANCKLLVSGRILSSYKWLIDCCNPFYSDQDWLENSPAVPPFPKAQTVHIRQKGREVIVARCLGGSSSSAWVFVVSVEFSSKMPRGNNLGPLRSRFLTLSGLNLEPDETPKGISGTSPKVC